MINREHFIAALQACYFGDRNAFEEIIRIYDEKENIIKEVREYINNHQLVFELSSKKQIADWYDMFYKELLEILDKENK